MRTTTRMAATGTAVLLAVGGVLAGGVATASPPSTGPSASTSALQADLVWGECPQPTPLPNPDYLECTTMEVPLDYQDPDGETIELMISRVQAGDPEQRRGVLLVNPGGPGGSGIFTPATLVELGMPASVTDQYDLVGFDPRGVSYSTPLTCGFDTEQQRLVTPQHATDADEVASRLPVVEQLADQCAQADQDGYLPHITTANTARDMDQIRQALGEEQVSYLGYSYGTYLGSVYAQLFPERIDRMMLDSAVGPEWVWREEFRRWGQGGEEAFTDFAEWAAAQGDDDLGSTPEEVRQTFLDLAETLDETPVGDLDGTWLRWQTFTGLYNENRYESTVSLWRAALDNDAQAVAAMARPAPMAQQVPQDNQVASQLTILCSDAQWPTDVAHYQEAVETDGELYPLFGAMTANMWPCAAWPYDPIEPTVEIDETAGQNGVLILQNLRDPATVLEGAEQLQDNLGANARLVRIDDAGHAAYLFDDNACAFEIASDYLATGELPDGDVSCPDGSSPQLQERVDERKEVLEQFYGRQPVL